MQVIMKTNRITRTALMLSVAAMLPLSAAEKEAAVVEKTTTKTTTTTTTEGEQVTPVIEKGSLTNVIQDSASFSILSKALVASGLDQTLGTKGTYTIFAPTDEAFQKLPKETLDKLLLPENKEKLRSLLLYHVVPGKVLAAELKEGDVKTMNGEKLAVDIDGDKVKVEDSKVFTTDQMASNGVMHSVGEVLVPKSMDGYAKLDEH